MYKKLDLKLPDFLLATYLCYPKNVVEIVYVFLNIENQHTFTNFPFCKSLNIK